jgi:hypothetical protein
MTEKFTFCSKKPNLQVVETDEKGMFNFHFPKDAEGLEGFDRAVAVMEKIRVGATAPSQLPPLVSIPATVWFHTLHPCFTTSCTVAHATVWFDALRLLHSRLHIASRPAELLYMRMHQNELFTGTHETADMKCCTTTRRRHSFRAL